jgi:hypothetical protein
LSTNAFPPPNRPRFWAVGFFIIYGTSHQPLFFFSFCALIDDSTTAWAFIMTLRRSHSTRALFFFM